MKKHKPKQKYWIVSPYWYNPMFWIIMILTPFIVFFIEGIKRFKEASIEIYKGITKRWDLY